MVQNGSRTSGFDPQEEEEVEKLIKRTQQLIYYRILGK